MFLALWSASGGMTTLMSALHSAYHVHESRSWIKVHAIALGLTIAIAALVVSALFLLLAGDHIALLVNAKFDIRDTFVIAWRVLQFVAALLFIILSYSLIDYFAPDLEEQHWYWITPGSLIAALLWLAASIGLRIYLHFFNSYSKTYGSLGAVIILLLWFYLTGFAFLVGGEVNARIKHSAAEQGHPEAKAEGEKKAALVLPRNRTHCSQLRTGMGPTPPNTGALAIWGSISYNKTVLNQSYLRLWSKP